MLFLSIISRGSVAVMLKGPFRLRLKSGVRIIPKSSAKRGSKTLARLRFPDNGGDATWSSPRSTDTGFYKRLGFLTVHGATHRTFSDEEIITEANAPRHLLDLTRTNLRAFFDEVLG
jgi:hypothetical protein